MKILDTAMTEIVKGNSARYYSKYVVDGKEYTETLNNFKFQNMINPNNEITIGNTCSSGVTFSIYMPTVSLENKEITIFEGVKVGAEIKYIKLGIFTVTKQTSDGEYTSYEAYDRMYKADMPYFSDMAFPSTDKAILDEICGKLGISLATNIVTTHTISDKPQGYTYRETIGYMAMLQGCNAVINSDGNLELRWYKDSGYVLDGHKYYQQGVTFTTSKDFIIQKLTCNNTKSGSTEQSEITSGDGATGLSFANPFMTQAILDEVYKKIGGFTFRPLTVKFVGDYRLEVGDIITVNKSGVDYKVPIMQITHECDGGLMDTVASIGQSDTENTSVASGPITKQMERYYANLLVVNKALINKLDVDTAKITYATITNLTAVKGDVDYLKVNNLTVDKANLLYASIERMEVVEGQIRNLNVDDLKAQVANINTLMFGSASGGSLTTEFSNSIVANIGDAQIKSAMIESIAADKITAGKIYTNLVEILSESGNLDITDNTIQIKDDNKVARVQIGKDANSDYNMYVWDKSGNLMFDALGLTEKGVKREIIRNDMIKENANIAASKLDIESLFNVINEDGSHTLKSSKIYVDANKQTLDVAFKNMTTNVTNLQNTVTTQGTQLTAVQGQISSKIWQQDITTAVNNLQIGGRNLSRLGELISYNTASVSFNKRTNTYTVVSQPNAGGTTWGNGVAFNRKARIPFGKPYRVSIEVLLPVDINVVVDMNNSPESGSILEGNDNDAVEYRTNNVFSVKANTWTKLTWGSYNGNSHNTNKVDLLIWDGIGIVPQSSNITWYVKNPKIELGNKATDWSPAPEDIDSDISAVDTKVTTVSNQYTTLNQSLTSLTATVNSNTTKINSKADGSTVTALQANVTALTVDLSGFKTSVSETYTSKTEFNNLDIGGRNLALQTKDFTNNIKYWYIDGIFTRTVDEDGFSILSCSKTNTTGPIWNRLIPSKKIPKEDMYKGLTVSFDFKCDDYDSLTNGCVCSVQVFDENDNRIGWYEETSVFDDAETKIKLDRGRINGEWVRASVYFNEEKLSVHPRESDVVSYATISFQLVRDGSIHFRKIKMEYGNKATDWSPAPEDTDEKFTQYSTTMQMNSAITQSANSVLTTVSSNYATKASLELKVDKDKLISEINASADVITLKSNRFVLDSTNAKIAADGTVNFTGGSIGGWKIDKHSLYSDYDKYRVYIQTVTGAEDWAFSVQEKKADGKYYANFLVDATGYAKISDGYLATKNHAVGGKGIEINESTIKLYSWTDKDNLVGSIYSTYIDSGNSGSQNKRQSLVICSDFNDELHLDYMDENRKPYVAVAIDRNADNKVHMMVPTVFHNELQTYSDDYSLIVNSNFSVGKKGTEKIARFWCYNGGSDTKSVRIFNSGDESGKYLTNCELSLWGTGAVQYNWSVNGTIYGNISSDSDRNIKKDIKALDIENSAQFIYSLIPSEFRFKNGTSNRLHHGLIAQEVKESMKGDWGVFIDKAVDDKNYNAIAVDDLTGEQTQLLTARYGLRYDELIADLIATVQSLNNRLKALEQ